MTFVTLIATGGLAAGCTTSPTTAGPTAGTSTGTSTGPASAAPSGPVGTGPDAKLWHAITALAGTTSTFAMTVDGAGTSHSGGTLSMTGGLDPAGQAAVVHMSLSALGTSIELDDIARGDAIYLKLTGVPGLSGRWMKVTPDVLSSSQRATFGAGADPTGVALLPTAIVTATEPSPGTITGTLDLSKTAGSLAFGRDRIAALDGGGKAVPFTATVDAQGRLTRMTILAALGGQPVRIDSTYRDFGAPVVATAPDPAQTTEANGLLYQFLATLGG